MLLLFSCSWGTELSLWCGLEDRKRCTFSSMKRPDWAVTQWLCTLGFLIWTLHKPGHVPVSPRPQLHPHTLASASLNLRGLFPWIYLVQNLNSKFPTRPAMCLPTNSILSELWNVVSYLSSFYGLDLGTAIQ